MGRWGMISIAKELKYQEQNRYLIIRQIPDIYRIPAFAGME
jgi:hypothetical protein